MKFDCYACNDTGMVRIMDCESCPEHCYTNCEDCPRGEMW